MTMMKSYNVKQISDMLNTNPETVRRWIRDGKLIAEQSSRKGGNLISEESLQRFLAATPRYARSKYGMIATMAAATSSLMSVSTVAGSLVAGLLIGVLSEKRKRAAQVQTEDIKEIISKDIAKLQTALSQKEALLEQTQVEIDDLRGRIAQFEDIVRDEEVLASIAARVNGGREDEQEGKNG